MAARARARHTGDPPPRWWPQRVAPAPATRPSALPSKATSQGHSASSQAGAGFQRTRISQPRASPKRATRRAQNTPQAAQRVTTQSALACASSTRRGRGHQPAPGGIHAATAAEAYSRPMQPPASTDRRVTGQRTILPPPKSPVAVRAGVASETTPHAAPGSAPQAHSGGSFAQACGSTSPRPFSSVKSGPSHESSSEEPRLQALISQAAARSGSRQARPSSVE